MSEKPMLSNNTRPPQVAGTPVQKVKSWCRENLLLILTIAGVVFGVILGFIIRIAEPSPNAIMIISFPGEILMRALKMLILPLIVSSLIVGVSSLDAKASGHMGLRTLLYYFGTTFMAIIIGVILVVSIHPGDPVLKDETAVAEGDSRITSLDALLDLIRNFFPDNLAQAMFQHVKTSYSDIEVKKKRIKLLPFTDDIILNGTILVNETTGERINATLYTSQDGNFTKQIVEYVEMVEKRGLKYGNGINVLGLICFCVGFSIFLSKMGPRGQVMIDFFDILNDIVMKLIILVMWYSPFGIMFLICGKILELEDIQAVAARLGLYIVTVVAGLGVHALVSLPLTYFIITRKSPLILCKAVFQAWITALATASSSATLPVTFQCLEDTMKIDKRVTRFVLPVGATINMDGTALYEAVAPIFIAQMNGIELSFGQILTVSLTATCAAIGAAAIPSAGLVTMLMVLTSVGLPVEDVSLILAVDWFLDRLRTSVNVLGDSYGAAVVAHLSKAELAEIDKHNMIEVELGEMDEGKRNGGDNVTEGAASDELYPDLRS
ncbi:excitatory amino acid transporter-like [Ruditapes philippinarum]|uniref:excitatory amino acid transporter-like n=1 Tax=Ruditapes philippinarum TaxID=129788 RepID=UPI00295BA7AF|nr:excitatory amino acid transporter-like [Ruditapes philippinarum]XP_060551513.1 excitatory amino acid transporter-like [Ruditapes philippinarum]XP_060551514.1 excitatory amino acid transporter-like [Ruditapes philippinarum]